MLKPRASHTLNLVSSQVTPEIKWTLGLTRADSYMHRVSASCAQANPLECSDQPCVVVRNATYDADYACGPCPVGRGYAFKYAVSIEAAYTCSIECLGAESYYNKTSDTCLACDEYKCPDG